MSMSITGFAPPDEKWKAMKAVYDSCRAAGVHPPKDVEKFFDFCGPDEAGVVVEIAKCPAVREHSAEMEDGFEVDIERLKELYPNVKFIRVVNHC